MDEMIIMSLGSELATARCLQCCLFLLAFLSAPGFVCARVVCWASAWTIEEGAVEGKGWLTCAIVAVVWPRLHSEQTQTLALLDSA